MPRMPRIQALTARKRAAPAPSSASDALAGGRLKRTWDLLLKRAWDVLPLPELYERYRRNLLTDGVNFLRGDAHIGLFTGSERESATWRPVPGPGSGSYSRATLDMSEERTILLRGHYGGAGASATAQLLAGGSGEEPSAALVGLGAAGMASTAKLPWDLSQHHWLEITLRTDGRPYELALYAHSHLRKVPYVWRAPIPVGPPPSRRQTSHAAGGPYDVLGVDSSATAEDIRNAYRVLAKEAHPDVGGTQSRFQALQKAYAVLSDDTARKRFDEVGPERDDDSTPAPHKSRPDSYCPTVCVVAAERAYARRLRRRARTR